VTGQPTPHDTRLDDPGEDQPGVLPRESDLVALASTRRGLALIAPGLLLVLLGVVPLGGGALAPLFVALRLAGWSLLALGLWVSSPTPDGPLPRGLRELYVLVFALGALRTLWSRFDGLPELGVLEQGFVWVLDAALLLLPWILYRFCLHRGLTGRAITWLWCALALAGVFVVNLSTHSTWALWLCPAIGLVLAVNARQSARDVWLDAVYKNARVQHLARESAAR
jgi:hypothetical protein